MSQHQHSPLPWKWHSSPEPKFGVSDWIEDADGNVVVENIGQVDGQFVCKAANRMGLTAINADPETANASIN